MKAATLASEKGCRVVTFTGFGDNRLRRIGHVNVYVPASTYGRRDGALLDLAFASPIAPRIARLNTDSHSGADHASSGTR